MSDSLLPYYERELDAIKRLAAEFADTHPKIAGRLRLSADAVDDPHVARLLEGVAFLAARVHHRLDDEFPELTDALLGLLYPHYLCAMPSCMVVKFDCQPDTDQSGAPARRHRDRHRTGARRGTALPHHGTRDALADRGGECPALRPADRGPCQSIRRRRSRRAAHHPEMRLARGDVHPARRRPAALLPAWPDQSDAGALRAAGRTRHLDRLRRQRGGPRAGHRARQRDRAWSASRPTRRCCPGRRAASPAFDLLTEYFAFPEKFLFFDFARHGRQDHGVRRQPAGDLRLPGPFAGRTGTHRRPAIARAWLHAAGQPVSTTLRAGDAEPHRHRISHRAGRPSAARRGDLERRRGPARHCPTARSAHGGRSTG